MTWGWWSSYHTQSIMTILTCGGGAPQSPTPRLRATAAGSNCWDRHLILFSDKLFLKWKNIGKKWNKIWKNPNTFRKISIKFQSEIQRLSGRNPKLSRKKSNNLKENILKFLKTLKILEKKNKQNCWHKYWENHLVWATPKTRSLTLIYK